MMEASIGTKTWTKLRRFRITASNAEKFLKSDAIIGSLLDPEPFDVTEHPNLWIEKAIRLAFSRLINHSGLWIDQKYDWLCSTPDGLAHWDGQLIPVEIKCIQKDKKLRAIALEYYLQLQIQMQTTQSRILLFIVYFKETSRVESALVERDDEYLENRITLLQAIYHQEMPMILFPRTDAETIENLINYMVETRFTTLKVDTGPTNSTVKKMKAAKSLRIQPANLARFFVLDSQNTSFEAIMRSKRDCREGEKELESLLIDDYQKYLKRPDHALIIDSALKALFDQYSK